MRKIGKDIVGLYEEVAVDGLKAMRRYFRTDSTDDSIFKKARIGAIACANYVRLQATETNRAAVELATRRMDLGDVGAAHILPGDGESAGSADALVPPPPAPAPGSRP